MTFQDLADRIVAMNKDGAKARTRRAIEVVAKMAPKRRPTAEETRKHKSACLCSADLGNLPMWVPDMGAEINDDALRYMAIGLLNVALQIR